MWPFRDKTPPAAAPVAPVNKPAPIAPQEDPVTRIINTVNNLPQDAKIKMNQAISKLSRTFRPAGNETDIPRPSKEHEKY